MSTMPPQREVRHAWSDGRHDVVESIRSVVRRPLLSGAVVLSLGLGSGMNKAVFSVVNAVLLRPLAYADPEKLVHVRGGLKGDGVDDMLWPGAVFAELQRTATPLEAVAAAAAVR
jgi:hypothetical protein